MKTGELVKFIIKGSISLLTIGFGYALGKEAEKNYNNWNQKEGKNE
ncbi:hypothetical protein [Lentimicrobium sp. S6]|nr:hypothetical protein [Lentimicrobium sp. S6]NPD46897.1 hypothetical protein [Lentimicrobium sp. S6]